MFKKNLEGINNAGLKERLEKLDLEQTKKDMSYCMTPSNDYLLMKNEVPLDDLNDPRKAAQEMLKNTIKQQMTKNDIIIVFGIGLGYLLDETFNTYESKIYLYEPDLDLLHFVLNNIDISEHLSSGRIYISDKLEEIIQKLTSEYVTKDKVEIVYLKNYAIIKSQELLELSQKVYEACRSKIIDINTITRYSKAWTLNAIKNLGVIKKGGIRRVSDLENRFVGQTALILAAGPSLKDNYEKIKANRGKFVVFAVNKVLKDVLANGITPDFVVCLDPQNIEKTFEGLDSELGKINCICDIKSSNLLFTKAFKNIYVTFSAGDVIAKKLQEFNPSIVTYECGGSAATMSLVVVSKLGFSRIIFSGLDLAFKNDVAYASGETINKISENMINADHAQKELTKIKSVTGEDVLTREDYAAYVKHFETLIKEYEITDIYNTTSFGAAIEGMRNVPFDNISLLSVANTTALILGEVKPFTIETSAWTQQELYLINNVIALLAEEAFSPALVSSIVKSPILYQYMQAEVLKALQSRMNDDVALEFIETAKAAIKNIVELLQVHGLI